MSNRLATPDDIFREGKRIFVKAGNDPDLLELAVQKMDAALLERVRALYPSLDAGPKRLFDQLQTDHIIDAAGRALILWGHSVRNMSAHAKAHSLTYSHVEDYTAVVKIILDKTGSRRRIGPKPKQRTSNQPRSGQQQATGNRSSSVPQPNRRPVAAHRLTDPRPGDTPQSTSPQREVEVGSSAPAQLTTGEASPLPDSSRQTEDNNELLRRLLSIP